MQSRVEYRSDEPDSVSERVAAQYERYLYPPPLADLASAEASARTESSDPKYYAAKLWPEGLPRKNLRILSAGCGTNQAAHLAYSNPDCSVLGIDLSEASLAHEHRLAERHGLKNLKLERRNLLDIAGAPERFDLIVCTGVLHHMEKPDEGLRALASALAPRGVLYAMVYANGRRAGVYFLQDMFRRLGLVQEPADIKFARSVLKSLPAHHFLRAFLPHPDSIDDADLVDIFLNPQDRAYSVEGVLDLIARAGLMFQGWDDNGLYAREVHIDPSSPLWARLDQVSPEAAWSIVDDFALATGRHTFMARHPHDRPPWRIGFEGSGWLKYKPVRHPGLLPLGGGRFRRGRYEFSRTPLEQAMIHWSDGETSIGTIAERLREPASLAERRAMALGFFALMWRVGHLFMRTG